MEIKKAEFLISQSDYRKCPEPDRPEIAFVGRSNVGKSSLINMLTKKKLLAKTSSKPGKTQLINHFNINDEWYLVDLPGYGYAKVSKKQKSAFGKMITEYLGKRENLYCVGVLIDSRLSPQAIDLNFINWLGTNGVPFVLIFTKADKLGVNASRRNIEVFKKALLETWEELPPIVLTSSETNFGRDDLLQFLSDVVKKTNNQ